MRRQRHRSDLRVGPVPTRRPAVDPCLLHRGGRAAQELRRVARLRCVDRTGAFRRSTRIAALADHRPHRPPRDAAPQRVRAILHRVRPFPRRPRSARHHGTTVARPTLGSLEPRRRCHGEMDPGPPGTWTTDPKSKILIATWLASELWLNPWLFRRYRRDRPRRGA